MMDQMALQQSPDMLMAMMTDPRATPQQKMAAMSALNAMKGPQANVAPAPAMRGDATGISTMHPAFAEAVRSEMAGGSGESAPPATPQASPTTSALMSGAADAARVAGGMARGGAVRGYAGGGDVTTDLDPSMMTGGANAPAPTATPDAPDDNDKHGYYALIRKQLAGAPQPINAQDKWAALLEASLGTMAAASRPGATFLGSIGQGGLEGVQGFRQTQAARAEERMKNAAMAAGLAEHDQSAEDRKDALAQRKSESALQRAAEKARTDADRASRDQNAAEARDSRLAISQGSQAIQSQLAAAAAERAAAMTASAPTGVVPPSAEQAKSAGIPFEGIPNPYANVSNKSAEEIYKSNEKMFENNEVKQALVEGKNAELRTDLKRFQELNAMGITGPSNGIVGVGATKKFFSPELQEASSISDRLVPAMRQGLPGSASDLDVKMFRGAGPDITKDKAANDNRIAALQVALDNADDKAQFKRDFFAVHHHLQGADKAWQIYLNANPIFDHTKDKSLYVLNPNRKTYREFFGGEPVPAAENSTVNVGAVPVAGAAPARPPLSSFGK